MHSIVRHKETDPPGQGLRKRSVAESEGTFVRQLDRLLHRLGDLHLRISLARLPLTALGDDAAPVAQAIVENLRDPCVLGGVTAAAWLRRSSVRGAMWARAATAT